MSSDDLVYIDRGRSVEAVRKSRPLVGRALSLAYRVITSVARRLS